MFSSMEPPALWIEPHATATDKIMFWAALLVAVVMLLVVPRNKPVWTDELVVIQNAAKPLSVLLSGQSDNQQPPLYLVYIHAVIAIFGRNLAALRIASALPGIAVLVYVHRLASRFCPSAAVAAVWLVALSPALILYERMACDHALVAALATASTFYFLAAVEQGRPVDFVAYFACIFLMLITSYLCLFLLIAQGIGLLLRLFVLRELNSFNVLLCQLGAAVMFFPWFYSDFTATANRDNPALIEDATISLGLHGFVRRIGLPAYVHLVGETVYPWTWAAVAIAAIAAGIALYFGIRAVLTRPEWILPLSSLAVVILAAAVTSTSTVGADQSVGYMGKRVMFVIPLYYILLAAGYSAIPNRRLAGVVLAALLSVNAYSVTNYWLGQQFLNPAYVARWDTVVQIMKTRALGDPAAPAVVFSPDPAMAYYLSELNPPVPVQMDDEIEALLAAPSITPAAISASQPTAVPPQYAWVIIRDRGNRLAFSRIDQLRQQLAARYPLINQFGVMPRSDSERFWMKQIFNRDADPFYITLQLYDLTKPFPATQPAVDSTTTTAP